MSTQHLLVALACATVATSSFAATAKPAGNPAAGQQKSAACGGCHGPDGNNPPEMYAAIKAPKLAGQVPEYIVKSLHDFKAARRSNEVMSPQAQAVAEADMADIAAWFGSQKVQPNPAQNKDLLAQGEKIFMKGKGRPDVVAACIGCHAPKGAGNKDWAKIMSNPPAVWRRHWRPACRLPQRSAQGLQDRQARHRPGQGDARYRGPDDDKDIAAVAEYIATLGR
jgi:cytochrome c553